MMSEIKTELEWSITPNMVKTEPLSPTPQMLRPQERQLMRPWLWDRLEQQDVPGMFWVDKEKLQFRIPWKHGSRQGWAQNKDAVLFQMWAEHTGKYRLGDERSVRDPKTWKATFRCALNSLPDVKEVPSMSEKRGPNAYRVYQFFEAKKSRRTRRFSGENAVLRKTTRKLSCFNREPVKVPTLAMKRSFDYEQHYEMSDDNDDGVSDTTDDDSEDFPCRPVKRVRSGEYDTQFNGSCNTCNCGNGTSTTQNVCTCSRINKSQEDRSVDSKTNHVATNTTNTGNTDSKERNRIALQRYLKDKEVHKQLAQILADQHRLELFNQKLMATKQWVQTTQQTTTFATAASFTRPDFIESSHLQDLSTDEEDQVLTTSNKMSAVSELVQRCREQKNTSPLPSVDTLSRRNFLKSTKLSIPSCNFQFPSDLFGADSTPPLTPTSPTIEQVSSTSDSTSPVHPPSHHNHHPQQLYSPSMSPRARSLMSSPSAKVVEPQGTLKENNSSRPSPTYHTVTAAKENQVVMTPPGSVSGMQSQKDTERNAESPYSDLSDETVISMVDDMMTMTTTTVQTTVTAAPFECDLYDDPTFRQLFSSSQLLLANNGCTST